MSGTTTLTSTADVATLTKPAAGELTGPQVARAVRGPVSVRPVLMIILITSLVLAAAAGALLTPRRAAVAIALIIAARYAIAVATWGWGGPNGDDGLGYAREALIIISVPTVASALVGAAAAALWRASTRRSHRVAT